MTASLQPIAALTVPALQGAAVALDGSGTANAQTFTVTSSNPDVAATVAAGPFWTINVQYTDPNNAANSFSGPLTFQLFQALTPNTVNEIQTFTNDGYYTGKTIHRVAPGFPDAAGYVVQGGAPNPDGSGSSGQPGTPYANEPVQQLAFTGKNQIAIAHSSLPNSNDAQFFITTGAPHFLDYNYTVFGQLVAGAGTLTKVTQVPVKFSPALGENSLPVNPLVMSSVSLSPTNPNGTVLVDTTQAKAGETATITVTAKDPSDNTTQVRTFVVTVGAYAGPASPVINFRPFADPVAATTRVGTAKTVTLSGHSGYPNAATPASLTYALVAQPAHGTVSSFDAAAGTFVYTPNPGFAGADTFQYKVQSTGPKAAPATLASNATAVTITVPAPIGDYTGVGHSQLAVFRPASAQWYALGATGGVALGGFGATKLNDVPVPGDYFGVGHTELAVFRPATQEWIVLGPGGGQVLGKFGGPGDIPVPGDYDGVGKTEMAVFRPATAQWFAMNPVTNTGHLITGLNNPTGTFGGTKLFDVPVPGDYDGIGVTEMAVFRPSTSQWFVFNPVTGTGRQIAVPGATGGGFGATNLFDVPVPGDYDGIGVTELAVFRPSTAQWFVFNPLTGKARQIKDPNNPSGAFGSTNLVDLPASGPAASLRRLGAL